MIVQPSRVRRVVALACATLAGASLVACNAATPGTPSAGTPVPGTPAAEASEITSTDVTPEATVAPAAAEATARVAALMPTFDRVISAMGIEPGLLQLPQDVAVDDAGKVYVSDSKGVQVFGPDGTFQQMVGAPDLKSAEGIAVTPDGQRLYVTGAGPVVLVFGPDGKQTGTLGEGGLEAGQLQRPVDVTLDAAGNVYVAEMANAHVEKYDANGRHLLTIGAKGQQKGEFTAPRAVAVDSTGRIYVGLGDDFLIQRFNPDGSYLDAFGQSYADETMWQIPGLALDGSDNVYASQSISHVVQSFDTSPERPRLRWELGKVGLNDGEFRSPYGLAVKGDKLYVADRDNSRIQVFTLKP